MARAHLTLRPSRPGRIYVATFMTVWCGFLLIPFGAAVAAGSPAALAPLVMIAFGATLGYRLINLSVIGTADELLVRNYLSTRHVPKSQIEGFRIGSPGMGSWGKSTMTLLRDCTVLSMDAVPAVTLVRW